jgi:hypothetical protein
MYQAGSLVLGVRGSHFWDTASHIIWSPSSFGTVLSKSRASFILSIPEITTDWFVQFDPSYLSIWLRLGAETTVSVRLSRASCIGNYDSKFITSVSISSSLLFWVFCSAWISLMSSEFVYMFVFYTSCSASIISSRVLRDMSSFWRLSMRFSASVRRPFYIVCSWLINTISS